MRSLIFFGMIFIPLALFIVAIELTEWRERRLELELQARLNRRAAR